MSAVPFLNSVLVDGANGGIVFVVIIGTLLLVLVVYQIASAIKEHPKRVALKKKEKVRSSSKLYRELQSLNSSKRSIKGKTFTYLANDYVFLRTYKEWLAYDKENYLSAHKDRCERDLFNLSLFIDDLTIYKECVDKLWKKYKDDPDSVELSGIGFEDYSAFEEEVCKEIIIASPAIPELHYSVLVRCGYQRRKRTLEISQSDVEAFLASKPLDLPHSKVSSQETEKPFGASQTNKKQELAVSKEESELPEERNLSEKIDDGPLGLDKSENKYASVSSSVSNVSNLSLIQTENETKPTPIPAIVDSSFERFFQSIENLDKPRLFWATLSKEYKELVKYITCIVFANDKRIIPVNLSGAFGFRLRRHDGTTRMLFWFRKEKRYWLKFCFLDSLDGKEAKSIDAFWWAWKEIEKKTLEILFVFSSRDDSQKALGNHGTKFEALSNNTPGRIDTSTTIVPKDVQEETFGMQAKTAVDDSQLRKLLSNLNDSVRFYFNCSVNEKALIAQIVNYSISIDEKISLANTTGYFGFKRKWSRGDILQYWYWFRRSNGKKLEFAYRITQEDEKVQFIPVALENPSMVDTLKGLVSSLLSGKEPLAKASDSPEQKHTNPTNNDEITVPVDPSLGVAIDNTGYFFKRLKESEQQFIVTIIRYAKLHRPNLSVENTKNFLGFREMVEDSSSPFWFWFKKPAGNSLQFVYRRRPSDSYKQTLNLVGQSPNSVVRVLEELLSLSKGKVPETNGDEIPKAKSNTKEDFISAPKTDDFWERPFLYTAEIMHKCGMKGAVSTADIAAICTVHHYSYIDGVAFNNKYKSFADSIYQSCVVNSLEKVYLYSNPYNCHQYDRAITHLLDELKLFDIGEGKYLTNKALYDDYGISYAECHRLRDTVKKYLSEHRYFSLDSIRSYCSDCRFLEFSSSDRTIMQFIHSVLGRGIKTLIVDQDTPKAVFSTGYGEGELKGFFLSLMEGANAVDIYTIKDRVETLYGVNYNLDLIGKDSEKAGFYYSDDLEKIYTSKYFFYKEIQE